MTWDGLLLLPRPILNDVLLSKKIFIAWDVVLGLGSDPSSTRGRVGVVPIVALQHPGQGAKQSRPHHTRIDGGIAP